jgi:hypothetical protein
MANDIEIIAGPAAILWDSTVFYAQGDIVIRKIVGSWNPASAQFGTLGKRLSSIHYEISFTPVGILTAAQLNKLFPFYAGDVGNSIYTAANVPMVVWSAAGKKYTFTRAGISKMPSVRLSANSTAFGEMTFSAVLGLGKVSGTDADSFYAISTVAFNDVSFATTNLGSPGYLGTWGSYSSFETLNGFSVEIAMALAPYSSDRLGIVGHRITGFETTVRFTPTHLTEADFFAMSQNGATGTILVGQAFGNASNDLTIAGTGVQLVVPAVGPAEQSTHFGVPGRNGEVVMHSTQEFTAGVPSALLTWTIS